MATLRKAIADRGFTVSLKPPPKGAAKADAWTDDQLAKLDVKTISKGAVFEIRDHLVPGKVTVIDYYADWCAPCLVLGRELEKLSIQRGDIAIRKADIVDWESELAKHLTKTYKLPAIPYLRIYGPDGKFLGTVNKNCIADVEKLLPQVRK